MNKIWHMKSTMKTAAALAACLVVAMSCSTSSNKESTNETAQDSTLAMAIFTDEVMPILENKCWGCHKPDSKNEEAKEDLIWEDLPSMDKETLAQIMDEVLEVLEEGSMPPEKMLKKFPDKKLTEEEVAKLTTWAESTIAGLSE